MTLTSNFIIDEDFVAKEVFARLPKLIERKNILPLAKVEVSSTPPHPQVGLELQQNVLCSVLGVKAILPFDSFQVTFGVPNDPTQTSQQLLDRAIIPSITEIAELINTYSQKNVVFAVPYRLEKPNTKTFENDTLAFSVHNEPEDEFCFVTLKFFIASFDA